MAKAKDTPKKRFVENINVTKAHNGYLVSFTGEIYETDPSDFYVMTSIDDLDKAIKSFENNE